MMSYRVSLSGRMVKAIASTVAIAACLVGSPAYAADPFRTTNPHEIGDATETAFRTLFEQGDYRQAARDLDEAENQDADEPLVYAMQAAFAYLEEDWDAAADAVLKSYGGSIFSLENFEKLKYSKKNILNPPFIAYRNELIREAYSQKVEDYVKKLL